MSGVESNGKVGDKTVDGLSSTMRDKCSPGIRFCQLIRFDSFADRADLIQFNQGAIADMLKNGAEDNLGNSTEDIVTNELNLVPLGARSKDANRPRRLPLVGLPKDIRDSHGQGRCNSPPSAPG